MRRLRALLPVALLLALPWPSPAAEAWAVPEADWRLPLRVLGDLYARGDATATVVLDFNRLLEPGRVLAAGSLDLRDAASGAQLDLKAAQDAQLRYASGNPILRLQWPLPRLAPFEVRLFHLYFRTVAPGDAQAWQPLATTFIPEAETGGLTTSFEEPDPAHADWPLRFTAGGWDQPGEKSERVWSDQVARTGRRSLKIARVFENGHPANTNRPFWWAWPPPIEVREGQSLRLEAWLKAVRLKNRAAAFLSLQFTDGKNQRLNEGRLQLHGPSLPHDWTYVSGVATAPAGARKATNSFNLTSDEGEVYCDDVRVSLVPGSSLPPLSVTPEAMEPRPAAAVETVGDKVLQVSAAARPPTVDGALDDPCWATAGRSSAFEVHSKNPDTPPVQTTVLACADREALYFGFICQEPSTERLLAGATERDGPLWKDDSVELFLDTNLDRHTYYQIIVNSRGVLFDQDTGAPGLAGDKWNGPIVAAAQVAPDRWTAEIKLQFIGLRLAEAAGSQWGANFARSSFRGNRALYTWVKVGANFGEPARFGRLVLPFDPAADVVSGRPLLSERLFFGQGGVPLEIASRREQPAQVRAVITADGEGRLGETTVAVPPRGQVVARVPCVFSRPGPITLRYDISEEPGGRLLYTTTVTHTVPPPLALTPDARVVYAEEAGLTGRWAVALDPSAASATTLEISAMAAGAAQPLVTRTWTAPAAEDAYALPLAKLPPGRCEVRARLQQAGQTIGEATYPCEVIAGPFAAAR